MSDLLRVAVVGHTNTGKTSLLRTLARDAQFGEVADRPGTTRRVQGIALLVDGRTAVEFLDTPGLEDSIGLLEHLDAWRSDRRPDGPAQIAGFLASPEATGRFAPEAAALRAVVACHAAIYVIDARDRILAKHRDELEILARCGRPVVPVLNFVAAPEVPSAGIAPRESGPRTSEWRELLARVNLHAVVEFDAVVFDEAGEIRLFEKLQTLLDSHRQTLQRLIEDRRDRARLLRRRAATQVASLLAEASQLVEVVDRADGRSSAEAESRLRDRLRGLEQRCTDGILAVFGFDRGDLVPSDLPLVEGRWGIDLFSRAALRRYGVGAGGGAAAGAATGLGIDLVVGGMTLGAAAALGAAIGGVAGALGLSGGRLVRKVRGGDELRASDRTLRLLGLRQVELVGALLRRGHAAVQPIRVAQGEDPGEPAGRRPMHNPTGAWSRRESWPFDPRAVESAIDDVVAQLRDELPETRADAAVADIAGGLASGGTSLGAREVAIRRAAIRLNDAFGLEPGLRG